ncbi:hypothetical protein VKT23_019234 [Stygiomarasmius scandens]|uniref:CxC2-like cysteine cluster KDZ transposase-associated domain-containing protein n=1 Tax=Marasmiellus scandens TaxID=2682957 RepID=A0ABR1IM39_9AGAR
MLRGRPVVRATHERLPDQEDYSIINSRDVVTNAWGHTIETPAAPQIGSSWTGGGQTWGPEDDTNYALEADDSWVDMEVDKEVFDNVVEVTLPKKKRSKVSRRVDLVWAEKHRQEYLDELVHWDGRGDALPLTACPDCTARKTTPPGQPEIACMDCFLLDMTCSECCIHRHIRNPLHKVKRWNGTHFTDTSLSKLGLTIQLCHLSMRCKNPNPCHSNMRILHTNGIHEVNFLYCNCERSLPHAVQLLRRGFYPSTHDNPQTVATFSLLRLLHHLSITSKGSNYNFYETLERLTDNTGLRVPKSRYVALKRMTHQWKHLKLLKRGGRAHDSDLERVVKTKDGQIVIKCPSCPHPGINVPLDLSTIPEHLLFLFRVMIVMDANFKLKNQLVSSYSRDPGFGIGWAYFVPRLAYEAYLLSNIHEDEL